MIIKKKKNQKNKKGFFYIDFIFIIIIFILIFIFLYKDYLIKGSNYKIQSEENILNREAKDLCFLLIKTAGNPINWETDINKTIYFGLKSPTNNFLAENKINAIKNNYEKLYKKLEKYQEIGISITGIETNKSYLKLGVFNDDLFSRYIGRYRCYAQFKNETTIIDIEITE